MTKPTVCALALLLIATLAHAGDKKPGISISLSSDDPKTQFGARLNPRDARTAITTRDGSVMLLLMSDVVAVQLSDRALANVAAKPDANLLEEIVIGGVQVALRKAVEYPIASIRSAEIRDGAIVLTNEKNQPIFGEIKVNGTEALKDFAIADAARFVNAVRAAKAAQR